LFLSILILIAKLTNKGLDYAIKYLLISIIKVKVKAEERLIEISPLKISNNSRAKN
jgi:hypothetical protein